MQPLFVQLLLVLQLDAVVPPDAGQDFPTERVLLLCIPLALVLMEPAKDVRIDFKTPETFCNLSPKASHQPSCFFEPARSPHRTNTHLWIVCSVRKRVGLWNAGLFFLLLPLHHIMNKFHLLCKSPVLQISCVATNSWACHFPQYASSFMSMMWLAAKEMSDTHDSWLCNNDVDFHYIITSNVPESLHQSISGKVLVLWDAHVPPGGWVADAQLAEPSKQFS